VILQRHLKFWVAESRLYILLSMAVRSSLVNSETDNLGILARDIDSDQKDLDALGIEKVDFVVCNLYPFKETVAKPFVKIDEAVEEIDIGIYDPLIPF